MIQIVKLTPDQVAEHWPYIRKGLEKTQPVTFHMTAESLRNILKNMLMMNIQCWAVLESDDPDPFYGFILTTIYIDWVSESRFLNIYDVFSFKPFKTGMLESAYKGIEEFARTNNCPKIMAYTKLPYIVQLAERFGFNSDCRLLMKEV